MSSIGLDPTEAADFAEHVATNPGGPPDEPWFTRSTILAPLVGVGTGASNLAFAAEELGAPIIRPNVEELDKTFGTSGANWLDEQQRTAREQIVRQQEISPQTFGIVGDALKSAFQYTTEVVGGTALGTLVGGATAGPGGAAVGAPAGAVAVTALAEGLPRYYKLINDGIDKDTAAILAGVEGLVAGGTATIPMVGKTVMGSIFRGAVLTPWMNAWQRGVTHQVLDNAGYHDMAEQYKFFDRQSIITDFIMGGLFGGIGYAIHGAPPAESRPALADAALTDLTARDREARGPGIPADAYTRNANVNALEQSVDDMLEGKVPEPQNQIDPERAIFVPDPSKEAFLEKVGEVARAEYPDLPYEAPPAPPAPAPPSVDTFANVEEGTEARVAQREDGRYAVSLRDSDSGQTLPILRIFTDRQAAIDYAKGLVAPKGKPPTPPAPGAPPGARAPIIEAGDVAELAADKAIEQAAEKAKEKAFGEPPVLGEKHGILKPADIAETTIDKALEQAGEKAKEKLFGEPAFTGEIHHGATTSVKIGDSYVGAKWAIVPSSSLEATIAEAENQARDRGRAASAVQVGEMANKLDYRLLGESPVMDLGAPTLSADGRIVGGNGRALAIQQAYEQGNGEGAYAQPLLADLARYGISDAARGVENPVLVRILEPGVDVRRAAIASNEGGAMRMSALEQARVDAERLPDTRLLSSSESGNLNVPANRELIQQWVGEFPAGQRSALLDADGALSAEGVTRLRNAVLFKAYGDSPTLTRLVESADPDIKNVGNALVRAAPVVAGARAGIEAGALYPADIAPDLATAVERFAAAKAEGRDVGEFAAQQGMFGETMTPEARKILAFLDKNARSSRAMADMISGYYERLRAAGDPHQADIFGTKEPPSKEALLASTIGDQGKQTALERDAQSALFDNPAMQVPTAAGEVMPAHDAIAAADQKIADAARAQDMLEAAINCDRKAA